MKRSFLLVSLLCLVICSAANANLILFDTYKTADQSTSNIVSVAAGKLGIPDLENLLRLNDLALPAGGSPFSLTYVQVNTGSGGNANNGADISWNLTGTGFNLLAVYVFGGSNGANLYKVDDFAQLLIGSATVHTPVTGGSGKYATISHILFLGGPAAPVPEGGSTLALFGLAIVALAGVRMIRVRA